MKIKTSPLENRILLLVVLVLTNPVITIAMNYIAWLQGGTAKYFIMLTHKFKHLIYFHISTYVAVAISQIFWPLLITLSAFNSWPRYSLYLFLVVLSTP